MIWPWPEYGTATGRKEDPAGDKAVPTAPETHITDENCQQLAIAARQGIERICAPLNLMVDVREVSQRENGINGSIGAFGHDG